jgi:hypothetical protein
VLKSSFQLIKNLRPVQHNKQTVAKEPDANIVSNLDDLEKFHKKQSQSIHLPLALLINKRQEAVTVALLLHFDK